MTAAPPVSHSDATMLKERKPRLMPIAPRALAVLSRGGVLTALIVLKTAIFVSPRMLLGLRLSSAPTSDS
ncbi:hypothetical protein [Bradyrhizobium sp. Gha]|uniref:hypothetical protein n=1 Tax=Bradyrhizobium sp. Gha TaxID=1855318 RepID=UPI000B814B23|nr:hypothetical protein [Bradyrhizobium sp. Gha]